MNKTKATAARFIILIVLSLLAGGGALSQDGAPMASKFDEYLSAAAKQGFTGSALVARDGKVIFSKGYGIANAEWDIPNTPQTKFRLGSITKQFTAASILLLQERGKLSALDPICKYFDNCPEAWKEITIHHLLTHTGGIPNFTSFPDYRKTMTIPHAAGALYSTVEDLFAWNEALFSGKLLSAKSREAMMTVDKNNYAYGLAVNQQHNRKIVAHGGGINGFNTSLARFPEEKVTVVVLRNADYGAHNPGKVSQDLAAILFGEKYEVPRERVAVKIDPKILDAYAGRYELRPDFIITMTREGDSLMTQATGQPKFELFPESETRFFLKVVEAQVTFVKD
jgi:CubicO group peptidase (beta-lactamase class C family)